jgi:allophanate hydrolase subunit 1
MTKVQLRFRLARQLDAALLPRITEVQAIYGIKTVTVAPAMDSILVEYDATRLRPAEVESALARAGIPIAPEAA